MYKSLLKRVLPYPLYKYLAAVKWDLISLFGYRNFKTTSVDYDEYWQNKAGYHAKTMFITDMIQNNSSVLDIGCGDGVTLEALQKNEKVSQAMGVDISKFAVELCRKKGLTVIEGDVTDKSFAGKLQIYDYVILADTIEHLSNSEDIMIALKGKFKKGMIVTIPNTGFFQYRLRLLFGRVPMQWRVFPGEHLRYWTLRDFKWWVDKLDFTIETFIAMFGVPVLKKMWSNLFCSQMLFLLKEK